jgi:hypothetical protein
MRAPRRRRRAVAPLPRTTTPAPPAPTPAPAAAVPPAQRSRDDLGPRDLAYVRALVHVIAATYDDPRAHRLASKLDRMERKAR